MRSKKVLLQASGMTQFAMQFTARQVLSSLPFANPVNAFRNTDVLAFLHTTALGFDEEGV